MIVGTLALAVGGSDGRAAPPPSRCRSSTRPRTWSLRPPNCNWWVQVPLSRVKSPNSSDQLNRHRAMRLHSTDESPDADHSSRCNPLTAPAYVLLLTECIFLRPRHAPNSPNRSIRIKHLPVHLHIHGMASCHPAAKLKSAVNEQGRIGTNTQRSFEGTSDSSRISSATEEQDLAH